MLTETRSQTFYRQLPLIDLVRLIVEKSDRQALDELLHGRPMFHYGYDGGLLLIPFIDKLRQNAKEPAWQHPDIHTVTDLAYNLTVDKFSNMPEADQDPDSVTMETQEDRKPRGPDCRLYFKAFLDSVIKSFREKPPGGPLEEETRAARLLAGKVRVHFYLSILEAKRSCDPFWSRYSWKLQEKNISVWLPVSISGLERRKWLEKYIDDPDPSRPGERERIQAIIDRDLVRERFVTFDDLTEGADEALWAMPDSGGETPLSLPEAVAEEKCQHIDRQRPAIRDLGPVRLRQMIFQIFDALQDEALSDGDMAREHDLSKATYSRFAGSRWLEGDSDIPDLWLNTAHVLSTHPAFKELLEETNRSAQIQEILERRATGRRRQPRREE